MQVYDHILQGSEATEENALNHAKSLDWQAIILSDGSNIRNYYFIDSINGVNIYYDWLADYYFFEPSQESDINTE